MSNNTPRVRFAPAPTGIMHIGNIRAALMNFLYAKKKDGTFVLRIEDTDPERNYDPDGTTIMGDLAWLGLTHDEGPKVGGPYQPYFQSQRLEFYKKHLNQLIEKNMVYRCFCTEQELEKKRERQRAMKKPPRYDRTCTNLDADHIHEQLAQNKPFIWRIKLNHELSISIKELARKAVRFELKNFSDFPLTRSDGTFTFMFANFVDDLAMNITHVFRGEDHLSNTAGQAALYKAFDAPLPTFWHMPILTNVDGKKLSKRDFGFSLHDLRDAGYLPEAIVNYLAIIGSSFAQEIMTMNELIQALNLDEPHTTGQIKYDVEKLRWVNRQWINKLEANELASRCYPFIHAQYPSVQDVEKEKLAHMLNIIKPDLVTLADAPKALWFYFAEPGLTLADLEACIEKEYAKEINNIVTSQLTIIDSAEKFVDEVKKQTATQNIPTKQLYWFMRLALMGTTKGPGIHDLIQIVGTDHARERITKALELLQRIF